MTHNRLDPKDRRELILDAAVIAAERHGLLQMTRAQIAKIAGVTEGLVGHYFTPMAEFRRQVMRRAIKQENLAVVAQGLALRDRNVLRAPEDLKQRALAHLLLK